MQEGYFMVLDEPQPVIAELSFFCGCIRQLAVLERTLQSAPKRILFTLSRRDHGCIR